MSIVSDGRTVRRTARIPRKVTDAVVARSYVYSALTTGRIGRLRPEVHSHLHSHPDGSQTRCLVMFPHFPQVSLQTAPGMSCHSDHVPEQEVVGTASAVVGFTSVEVLEVVDGIAGVAFSIVVVASLKVVETLVDVVAEAGPVVQR